MTKLTEGDTVGMQGEVSRVHDDGRVTVHLHGYGTPVNVLSEHLTLIAKKRPEPKVRPKKGFFDAPD